MSEMKREIHGIKTAITELAAAMTARFDTVDGRFKDIDNRFDAVDGRSETADERLKASDEQLNKLVSTLASHDARMTSLDATVLDVQSVNRRIISTIVRLEGKMDDMAERMATKDDIAGLTKRIDGLSGSYEDIRYRWAVHADTLSDHAKRLKKLESKRA